MTKKILTPTQILEELDLTENLESIVSMVDAILQVNPDRGERMIQELRSELIEKVRIQMVECLAQGYECAFDREMDRKLGITFSVLGKK